MFGIGLPELILIMAVALVVVGPEKLPELARALGKGIVELKKAASSLKESFEEEDDEHAFRDKPDKEQQPNKLLEAYNSLPKDAMPEEPGAGQPELSAPDKAAEASAATAGTDQTATAETTSAEKEDKSNA